MSNDNKRAQLIDAVFDLNRYPSLGEEQWSLTEYAQGGLTYVQARHRAVLRAIRPLIADMGAYLSALPEETTLSKQTLEDYIEMQQAFTSEGSIENDACNTLRLYLLSVRV